VVLALIMVMRLSMPEAVGTSLVVIAINSAVALATRAATVGIPWSVAIPFTLTGLVGVEVGCWLTGRISQKMLMHSFVAAAVVASLYTVTRSALALWG